MSATIIARESSHRLRGESSDVQRLFCAPVIIERRCAARAEMVRRGIQARLAANDVAAALRAVTRDLVHEAGVAAVADALGLAHMLDLGGVMTGARARELDGRKGPISSKRFTLEKASDASGMAPSSAPKTPCGITPSAASEKRDIVVPAPGLLAADIGRLIRPERQRQFGPELWLGVTL